MDLPLLSASFLAFTLTLYVILDGFDLGVGILLLFQPAKASRDHMVDSITPTWDGNETWIIMAGVTLLAAFPIAYSILLPAFYLPVIAHAACVGISRRLIRVPRAVKRASSCVGRCIRSWLASGCIDAGTHFGWPHAGGDGPEPAFRRKCSGYLSSSTHNQWHHSSVRLCRTWSGMAQTEIECIAATLCESLPSCF